MRWLRNEWIMLRRHCKAVHSRSNSWRRQPETARLPKVGKIVQDVHHCYMIIITTAHRPSPFLLDRTFSLFRFLYFVSLRIALSLSIVVTQQRHIKTLWHMHASQYSHNTQVTINELKAGHTRYDTAQPTSYVWLRLNTIASSVLPRLN